MSRYRSMPLRTKVTASSLIAAARSVRLGSRGRAAAEVVTGYSGTCVAGSGLAPATVGDDVAAVVGSGVGCTDTAGWTDGAEDVATVRSRGGVHADAIRPTASRAARSRMPKR